MSATATQAYVEPQPSPFSEILEPLTAPAKTIAPSGRPHHYDGDGVELQHMPSGGSGGGGRVCGVDPVPGPSLPASPPGTPADERNDLEMSRPPSPAPGEVVETEPSVWDPPMNKWRLLSVCLANLGNGLGDSAAGALIPYMEKYYNIGYGVVSLIFVGQAVGFVISAAFIDTLRQKTGRAGLLGIGQGLMILGFVPVIAGAPWALVACSFFLVGFGLAINVAMGNTFCGGLRNGTFHLGLLHGSYGIGGTTGPLMATALVTAAGAVFSRYYLITAGLGLVTLSLCVWSFRGFEKELSPAQRAREAPAEGSSAIMGMLGAMRLRTVLLGSTFIFAYQGAEVSISGWVISFLIQARGGDPSSVGYVSSGFWAGITIGRFVLSVPAQRIGEKRFVYFLTAGALLFQILVWLVPNVIGNAVAVSIVGLMLGPIYPCAAAVCLRTMSRRDALSGMSTISAFGSLGGAIAPFITGLLAQAVGVWILHPIVIFLCLVMLLCWWGVPTTLKRDD